MKLNKRIINYHINYKKIINYNYIKYNKIKIVNYFGDTISDLCFEIRVGLNNLNISSYVNYNWVNNKNYYAIINQNIIDKYEYNILCNMLTYMHNINLFNCICLVKENKDQLYYGRRRER